MTDALPEADEILLRWKAGGELCTPFTRLLAISGASISMFGSRGTHSTICTSDALAASLDEIQFRLGEGPRWQTARTGRVTRSADLAHDVNPSWPTFSDDAAKLGVCALFTFPIAIGSVVIGAVDLYRLVPGPLREGDSSRARSLAHLVAAPAVEQAIRSAERHDSTEQARAPALRRQVHQASGMILIQLGITAEDALVLLRAHAFSQGRTLDDVAEDVIDRRLDFRDLSE